MSTLLSELSNKSTEICKEVYCPTISANIALSWQDPEDFVKDLKTFEMNRTAKDLIFDLSGAKQRWVELEKQLQTEKSKAFALSTPITPQGSNANWGRITQPHEMQGTFLRDLEIDNIKTNVGNLTKNLSDTFIPANTIVHANMKEKILNEGELSAPIVKSLEEEIDSIKEKEQTFCHGCNAYFATKASLKRHHERKKSCKDLCEKLVDLSGSVLEVPDKPYIIDWVDQMLTKSISNDSDKPYCRFCDVEFANKSNLHKHLSKSVACDKLAKQEFMKLLINKE